MKKHIIFGGFDYAVYWEMNHDAIYRGIDYFVDNNPELIGTTYMGKPICPPEELLKEDKNNIIILIGSIVYHTELEFQLKDMGFEEDIHYQWAISFMGDEKCPRLWHHNEWNDREKNRTAIVAAEEGPERMAQFKIISRLIDFNQKDTVVDLGAANGRMKVVLPKDVNYIPVDYIKYSEETVQCNLNQYEFPELVSVPEKTCIVMVAAIQYVHDWKWILRKVAENCTTFICTHNDFVRINREHRRQYHNGNVSIFNHQIVIEMNRLGFELVEAYDFQLRNVIMRFEKNR